MTLLPYAEILAYFRDTVSDCCLGRVELAAGRSTGPKVAVWIGAADGITQLVSSALKALGLRMDPSSEELDELVRAGRLVLVWRSAA
ncbi:hypothetical protein SCP_1005210 [Sparassis crispa]|uniref:Uncharacterized protein n=1 Tax=Sparassis crispa TaxID=139825 RepID=A0A401GYN9_9APHY|nr:hypothetical protein SCP_1005210 [Sparassis crispa]GBE87274.1 hypothetical protein SCP_1005210 [Sparassis crispa]